jgi:hypothetical protein
LAAAISLEDNMRFVKLSALLLGAFALSFQAHAQCSNASLNGTFFTTFGGAIQSGSATLAHQDMGKVIADGNGGLSGQVTASVAGQVQTLPVTGTYTIHANCSGTGSMTGSGVAAQFALQLVDGGVLGLASVTSSPIGQIGEGRFFRAANATGSVCGKGTLSGTYGALLTGGTYDGGVRTAYDAAYQATFDGSGGVTVAGEVTSGSSSGLAWNGSGTYSLSADCSGTAHVSSPLGPVNYKLARVEGGALQLLESDAGTTISGTATPQQLQEVLPQIAFGAGWYSALYFTNTTSITASFVVTFTADNGTPLTLPGIGTSKQVTLAPQASTIIEAQNVGDLTQGYATFSLPAGVTGYGVFRQSAEGRFDQEALVNFKSATGTATSLTWDDTSSVTTFALANPSSVSTTATITVWDSTGALVGTATVPLAAGAKVASAMYLLPGLGGMAGLRGSALITVPTGNVAVLGLRFRGSAFTSVPTTQEQ